MATRKYTMSMLKSPAVTTSGAQLRRKSTAVQEAPSSVVPPLLERRRAPAPEQRPSGEVRGRPPPIPRVPPGLKGRILGHAAFLQEDPKERSSSFFRLFRKRLDWYKETNSKTVMVRMANNTMVFCSDPAVYREVLGEKQSHFTNSNGFRDVFGYMFPRSMIVLEGPDWQRVRRVSQKAINRMDMDAVIGGVVSVLESAIEHDRLGKNGEDADTFRFLSHLTFDVFHKVMYSMDPKTMTKDPNNPHVQLLTNCEGLLEGIRYRTFTRNMKFLWKLPLKANIDLENNKKYIVEVGKRIVNERREALKKEPATSKDSKTRSLLDGLILSQDEEIMSDLEVYDQIATFFFGAYETTSNTLLFSLDSLADNPRVQSKLREELKKRFPNGKDDIAKASLADLDSVEYLKWVLDESFRLNSTAEGFPRDVIKDVVVGGYELKKGTSVMIDHRSVGRDPHFFQGQTDLDDFNPERYAKYPITDKLLSMPFGFGSRICPGRRIAVAEVKSIVALLVSEFEICPPSDPNKKLVCDSKLGLTCVEGTGFLSFRRIKP